MPRLARVVVPDIPHHVVQRGNRRQQTFFTENDYEYYLTLLTEWSKQKGIAVWAYCLMPNHVHLIVVPEKPNSLAAGIGEVHRRYTRMVNFRENWRGYLWQGRFSSCPMDEPHLLLAARYILLNPLRAGLVERLEDWPHSSFHAHLAGEDSLVEVNALAAYVKSWKKFLRGGFKDGELDKLRMHTRTGRPLGAGTFVDRVERLIKRTVRPLKGGRPKKKRKLRGRPRAKKRKA